MKITRITGNNAEFFEGLAPAAIMQDEDLLLLGAISDEDTAVACMAVGIDEGVCHIDWLYTDPSAREQGAACALLDTLYELLSELNVVCIEAEFMDDDEEIEDFLMDHNFLTGADNTVYSVPISDLIYSPAMEEIAETHHKTGNALPVTDNKNAAKLMEYIGSKELDVSFIKGASPKYSFICMDDSGEAKGCLISRELEDGDIEISYLLSSGSRDLVIDIFTELYKTLISENREDNNLIFTDENGAMIRFVERLTREDSDSYCVAGIRRAVRVFRS